MLPMFVKINTMPHKTLISFLLAAVLLSMFSGCVGSRSVRVIKGDQQIRSALTGSVYATDQAIIVHVNKFDRLATPVSYTHLTLPTNACV